MNVLAVRYKRKNIYYTMAVLTTIVSAIFIYMFYTNEGDLPTMIKNTVDNNAAPKFSQMIYGGFGKDALDKPMDASVIGQFIYITDNKNKRVQVFDLSGTPIFKFGSEGSAPGQFQFPYGIDGDNQGNVYVADLYNGCISVHDSKGKFIKYFGEKKPGDKVLEAPGGLRIVDNKLYVTDIMKSKVFIFDLSGKKIGEIGKPGLKPGELRAPNAVTLDKDGNILVVDTGNQRVQVFDKKGKVVRIFNGSADGKGSSVFVNPRGIAVDSKGITYVVSNLTHFIYGFDKNGKQLFVFGGSGDANDKFSLPNGIYIDKNDKIYITDTTNQRVAVYN